MLMLAIIFCYAKFREELHKQGVLGYCEDGHKHNVHIFKAWRMLDPDRRTAVTFLGAFGILLLPVLILLFVFSAFASIIGITITIPL